jgi:hypothetical protein
MCCATSSPGTVLRNKRIGTWSKPKNDCQSMRKCRCKSFRSQLVHACNLTTAYFFIHFDKPKQALVYCQKVISQATDKDLHS